MVFLNGMNDAVFCAVLLYLEIPIPHNLRFSLKLPDMTQLLDTNALRGEPLYTHFKLQQYIIQPDDFNVAEVC